MVKGRNTIRENKMKIAFTGNVFPFGEGIAYGGERILYYLIQELTKLGHEIYLFTVPGCKLPIGVVADYIEINPAKGTEDTHFEAVQEYSAMNGIDFDVFHCNYFGDNWNINIIDNYPYCELVWNMWCHLGFQHKQRTFNTVSYSICLQDDLRRHGCETTMIHYGIPEYAYQFNDSPSDYAVWIGKVEGGKYPKAAIELALAAKMKIVLMAPPYNFSTFDEQITPYLNHPDVLWLRGTDDFVKQKVFSNAKVFISSNDKTWKEHFGIVNIESLATGTPIIAFSREEHPCAIRTDEIIEDGVHGFFLDYPESADIDYLIQKGLPLLDKVDSIDRKECRNQFEKKFTSELMAKRWSWFYEQIITGGQINNIQVPF
jgi:glycosyltransferase involved in cell wall biosynthesis